jgi:N-hydroxyarylamine O-acetyltransferase
LSQGLDLTAYFRRVGYDGPADVSVETLKALHLLHPLAIPFENLDVLLGRPIPLDPASLWAKLVDAGRGGYCYEQNGLFRAVLEEIGFRTVPLSARVRWNVPPERQTPRTHTAIFVELDGEAWLADVGFGASVFSAPLRLDTDEPQHTPHGMFRLTPQGQDLLLELQTPLDDRLPVYRLSLEPQGDADLDLGNWWVSTNPRSHFTQMLTATRLLPDGGRIALRNREFTERDADGVGHTRVVEVPELPGLLASRFDLPFAWSPELEPVFAGLPGPA